MEEVSVQLIPVRPFRLKLLCPECGTPLMLTDTVFSSYPPRYRHLCTPAVGGCGKHFDLPRKTGEIQYLDIQPAQQTPLSAVNEEAKITNIQEASDGS